jgi:hypothetical protein
LTGYTCRKKVHTGSYRSIIEFTDIRLVHRPSVYELVTLPLIFSYCLAGESVVLNYGEMAETRSGCAKSKAAGTSKQFNCVHSLTLIAFTKKDDLVPRRL